MFSSAHLNTRSLSNNFDVFRNHVKEYKYDVIGVSETWLHADISDEVVLLDNYVLVRQDRLGRGGGVAVYLKNTFNFRVLHRESAAFIEQIWIEVTINDKKILIGNIYRPPKGELNLFYSALDSILVGFYATCEYIILLGDFNINILNPDGNPSLFEVTEIYGLKQLISEPTRVSGTSMSLIDLIFSNIDFIEVCGVRDVDVSDHMLIFCEINFKVSEPQSFSFTYRNLHNIEHLRFQSDLELVPWHVMYNMPEIDSKVIFFTESILNILETHAPLKRVNNKRKPYSPWITPNIRFMQRLRNRALNKFRASKEREDWNVYKQYRNITTTAIRAEKRAYLTYKLGICSNKEIWSEMKKINISKKPNVQLPISLQDVDRLNIFFTDLNNNNNMPNNDFINFFKEHRILPDMYDFKFNLVDQDFVLNILRSIKSRAFGADNLNITIIRLCCPAVINPLTHIINCCLGENYFPKKWKEANIVPLPKIKNPTEFNNLRSISILPVFSKILEKIMERQILDYLNNNNLIPEYQSGFRKGYSCVTALSQVTDDIFEALDKDQATVLILLDFTKAFDMVNHEILLSLLHYVGFSESALTLVSSFLSNRRQRVLLNGKLSNALNIVSGVPQGSILGPLLYTIYTSQLTKKLSKCKHHCYADDTQIYFSFKPSKAHEANLNINTDLNNIFAETQNLLLKINPAKSKAMLFCSDAHRTEILNSLRLQMNNDVIEFQSSAKNLGLVMDQKLKFSQHVTLKLKVGYSALKTIYSQKNYLSVNIKKMLCDALVLSPLNFCDTIYGPCLDCSDTYRIQKLQNSCLRLIFGIRRREHISHKLKDAGWLNMFDRRELHIICFFL